MNKCTCKDGYPDWECPCITGKAKDKVVEAVRKDLLERSNVGIKKYGTTLDSNSGDLRYWLNHAYEECLDQANYLKRAIMEIDANDKS